MSLVQFKKNAESVDGYAAYHLKFNDGFEANISSVVLRDNCPCAGCKGEKVLLHEYVPVKEPVGSEGYVLENAGTVGNYALQLCWKDGHNSGIYTWEYLKEISAKGINKSI